MSHALVATVVAFVGSKFTGAAGAVVGAMIGVVAHEALDAPLAGLIADVT